MRTTYLLRAQVPKDSEAWTLLLQEIPAGAELQEAFVLLSSSGASVSLKWVGRKPDGTPHRRTTLQRVVLGEVLGGAKFLYMAFPKATAKNFEALMVTRSR